MGLVRGNSAVAATAARRLATWLRTLGRPPYRNALVIIGIAAVMSALFAASYSLALGRATPHHIAVGIVGRPAEQPRLIGALERATGDGLTFRPYASAAAARAAIDDQAEYGALVLRPGPSRLLVSSASGASVARVLGQAALGASQRLGRPLPVIDLHPLPRGDPDGLVEFYAALAASIMGFAVMFQVRANAPGISTGGRLALIAVLGVVGGLAVTLVVDPIIGALSGPFAELWLALGLEIAVAALVSSLLIVLAGKWAIIPTWLLFVVLGNTAAGGAVASPLLPPVYAFIGRFLPPGATVGIIRTAVYFRGHQRPEPFVVQAVWLVCALAALLTCVRLLGRRPGRPPVGQ
jgi:hypothetical protein